MRRHKARDQPSDLCDFQHEALHPVPRCERGLHVVGVSKVPTGTFHSMIVRARMPHGYF